MRDRVSNRRRRRWLPLVVFVTAFLPTCSRSPVAGGTAVFQGERAYADLGHIVSFGPREPGSAASAATRAYIRREVEEAGLTLQELAFTAHTPLGDRNMVNLIAEVKGTRPGLILISNHYDTKYFPDFEFLGANDGGSTTAWMIEMARVLGPTREGSTIWLCWFDGEEALVEWSESDSLYGSRHMVSWMRETGRLNDVHALINVDMIGDCSLDVIRDVGAPDWLLQLVWDSAQELKLGGFSHIVQSIEDDHVPFRNVGIPAINLIDFRYGGTQADHQMNWHTARDRIELVCPDSLETVGRVILAVLPRLEKSLLRHGGGGE